MTALKPPAEISWTSIPYQYFYLPTSHNDDEFLARHWWIHHRPTPLRLSISSTSGHVGIVGQGLQFLNDSLKWKCDASSDKMCRRWWNSLDPPPRLGSVSSLLIFDNISLPYLPILRPCCLWSKPVLRRWSNLWFLVLGMMRRRRHYCSQKLYDSTVNTHYGWSNGLGKWASESGNEFSLQNLTRISRSGQIECRAATRAQVMRSGMGDTECATDNLRYGCLRRPAVLFLTIL